MTREEALKELIDIRDEATAYPDAVCYVTSEDEDALNMAIEALQAKTDGDLISRQDAIEYLTMKAHCVGAYGYISDKEIDEYLSALPSAEPQPKPISYIECANAMLKMWIDNVLTDGEYYRIMEKLNSKHMADMRGGDDNE